MRKIFVAVVMIPSLIAAGPASAQPLTPESSGTFWVDRWGQGRFGPHVDFVDEALFPRLRPQIGVPIQLYQMRIKEDVDGEASVVKDFSSLKSLPQAATIRLKWSGDTESSVRRSQKSDKAIFQIAVTNKGDDGFVIENQDLALWVTVRHPPERAYTGGNRFYGVPERRTRPRGVLRYLLHRTDFFPRDMEFSAYPPPAFRPQQVREPSINLESGASHSWKVNISNWPPNEYELMVGYHTRRSKDLSGGSFLFSNPLFLDVVSDEPRRFDVVEVHVRQRDKTELRAGQPVPLEIFFENKGNVEYRFSFRKGTPDDLDLSDMLFCYGNDGRVLPLTKKVAGPMEIRIPVNESLTLPVDAPAGTEVARAVFFDGKFLGPIPKEGAPDRYVLGWHWSEHWLAPSVRRSLELRRAE